MCGTHYYEWILSMTRATLVITAPRVRASFGEPVPERAARARVPREPQTYEARRLPRARDMPFLNGARTG